MNWPPYLMKLRFGNGQHTFGLWLPLFLIWPVVLVFLLAVFIILLPFALLAVIFTWRSEWLSWLFGGVPIIFRLLFSLRGLTVQVDSPDGRVDIIVP
jgi:phosphoglycerol transferase MdoB-like AlkP superfamily enzyme